MYIICSIASAPLYTLKREREKRKKKKEAVKEILKTYNNSYDKCGGRTVTFCSIQLDTDRMTKNKWTRTIERNKERLDWNNGETDRQTDGETETDREN